MWYENEANFMKQMVSYTVPDAHIKAKRDAVKHLYSFQPAPQIIPDLVLYYPGYKKAVGDYKLTFLVKNLSIHISVRIFSIIVLFKRIFQNTWLLF